MKRALIHILFLLFLPTVLLGQPVKKDVPDYGFTHFDRNQIIFDGDSPSFDRFFAKMDSVVSTGEGNLVIVHIGGSHVQGGSMTRELRNNLLSIHPDLDGGRGLVFPFWAAHTNTPSSYKTRVEGEWSSSKCTQKEPEKRLGLTGIAVSTRDTAASIRLVLEPRNRRDWEPSQKFTSIRVLGYASGDFVPVVVDDSGDTLSGVPSLGDSLWSFAMSAPMDSIKIATRGHSGEFTITGVMMDNGLPGITVNEVGVNGASLKSYSRCPDFERDLAFQKPDLAILAVGINDAIATDFDPELFKTRYREMIQRVHSVNPDCAILFVTNNDSFRHTRKRGYYVNTNGAVAEKAFLELGKEYGAGVWDLYDIMGGKESMKSWQAQGLARKDKIHFTDEGYFLLGDLLYNALTDKYLDYLKR